MVKIGIFIIPNLLYSNLGVDGLNSWLKKMQPDFLILSGGNNIGENEDRDRLELFLLDYAKRIKMPVLGICRGMQIMSYWSGCKLKSIDDHVNKRHKINGEICKEVNSYHNESIIDCPENFKVLANSEDGEIEAIKHMVLPWEGWMWHPEREKKFQKDDIKRIKVLFGI